MLDESPDGRFMFALQMVVFQKDQAGYGLM